MIYFREMDGHWRVFGTAAFLGFAAELLAIALRDAVLEDLNLERERLLAVAIGLGGELGDQLGDPSEQHAVFGLQDQHAGAKLAVLSKQSELLCGWLLGGAGVRRNHMDLLPDRALRVTS